MTYLTITTPTNKILASSSTPSLLHATPEPSFLLRLLPLPSFLLRKQHITLHLPLLASFTPHTSSNLHATLRIGRQDAWSPLTPGQLARELTIIDAHLTLRTQLAGTRRVIGRYPRTSGLLSAGTFFVVSVTGMLVCFWRFAAPFDASAGMYGRRMRGFGGTAAMGGLGGFAGVGGGPGVAERLRMLERDRPARFGERTRANWERDREFEREIAREAAIKQEEESAASTVRHTFLNVGLG
jgi:hypothetical protein